MPKICCTKKAWKIWNEIATAWFDYDSYCWVSKESYNQACEIEEILRTGSGWDK